MRKWFILWVFIAASAASITQCGKTAEVTYALGQKTFDNLSDYNLFAGEMKNLLPNSGVLPYDLNSSLFSDYAYKARFLWVPEGGKVKFSQDEVLDFPKGSILIKNFYYPLDFREEANSRRIIETRLLIHEEKGWIALPYIWNDNQNEATLALIGGNTNVSWVHYDGKKKTINYSIPDKNQCKNCHQYKDKLIPIGPKMRNLNKDYKYVNGTVNQIQKWIDLGLLDIEMDYSDNQLVDYSDSTAKLEQRALAYLEINCGHCHNEFGSAHTSGLNLTIFEKRPANLGICKSPISAGKGTGGHEFDIFPGKADSSILLFRMISNDPSIMMPEIGRKLAHKEGVGLIRDWINSLEGSCSQN